MGRFAVRFQAFRSVAIGTATYAVGAALKLLPSLGVWMYLGLGGVVFACAAIDALATGVRPAVRMREIAPLAMDAAAAPIVAAFTAHGIAVRMNLLLARGSWRRLWCDRFFRMAWNIGMTDSPDVNIFFPVQAGIAGRCYASRRPVVAGPEDIARFPLPARYQRNGVDGLSYTAILCYPVYEPAREGLQSGKVIGVLTLDSLNPGALPIFQDGGMVASIAPHLRTLAGLAGRIYR